MSIGSEIATERYGSPTKLTVRLEKQKIITKSQNKINVAGRIDVMCFDKTGTLTEDSLDLYGVSCIGDSEKLFDPIIKKNFFRSLNDNKASKEPKGPHQKMLEAMACCHSLTHLRNGLSGNYMKIC
jgi:cation-transporting P-type ATPase 13A2